MAAVAHILHLWGGGTEKHVLDLSNQLDATSYIIKPNSNQAVTVVHGESKQVVSITSLPKFLQECDVGIIHIHQLIGHNINFLELARAIGAQLYVTLHDYFYLCPRFHLVTANAEYCGLPEDEQICNTCIGGSIGQWRTNYSQLLLRADYVIAPTIDVFKRYEQKIPNAKYVVVPHDKWYRINSEVNQPNLDTTILILGNVSSGKGAYVLANLVTKVRNEQLPIKFKLVGKSEVAITDDEVFSQTGTYQNNDEHKLISEINPTAILFPAIAPETYSYTLSSAIHSNLPIVAPRLGAFIERLAGRPYTKLFDSTDEILGILLNLDKLDKDLTEFDYSIVNSNFYQTHYFNGKHNYET